MMRLLLVLVFLLFNLFFPKLSQAQIPFATERNSPYKYVYKINNQEAYSLYQKGMYLLNPHYLHTLIDSIPYHQEITLPTGHYLILFVRDNMLVHELNSVNNLRADIINNRTDLAISLYDSMGTVVNNAQVKLRKKLIPFYPPTNTYLLQQVNRKGLVEISYKGHTTWLDVENQHKHRIVKKILYSAPIRYTWMPFRDIVKTISYGYPQGYVYQLKRLFEAEFWEKKNQFQGYIAFNKPIYRPEDTVRIKAFIVDKNGRPVTKKLEASLLTHKGTRKLPGLAPLRAGAYVHEFVLADSLQLRLDRAYTIRISDQEIRSYLTGNFRYEDYELKSSTYSIRSEHKRHNAGQSQVLYLKGVDANDLPLPDAKVRISVFARAATNFANLQTFVADTLWQHEQPLEAAGETSITLPDSIFPGADLYYTVQAAFLDASNELHTKKLELEYKRHPLNILLSYENDSLLITSLYKGQPTSGSFTMTALLKNQAPLFTQTINTPAKLPIRAHVHSYLFSNDSLALSPELPQEAGISTSAYRTHDSLFVDISNPHKLPVWYTLYHKNKVILRGSNPELHLRSTAQRGKYFISLHYLWNGAMETKEYEVSLQEKALQIDVKQPAISYPGAEADITIEVKDVRGRPVPFADLTAFAITSKFKQPNVPAVPYLGKTDHTKRKVKRDYKLDKPTDKNLANKLVSLQSSPISGLDSLEYYQFLYPEKALSYHYIPTPDSVTQFAPYVVERGRFVPIHIVYHNHSPVYFSGASAKLPYSFVAREGFSRIQLRLADRIISIDSIEIRKGYKLLLAIDPGKPSSRIYIREAKPKLSKQEINHLSQYLIPIIQQPYSNHLTYIKQDSLMYPLSFPKDPGYYGRPEIVGPIKPFRLEYVQAGTSSYRLSFDMEQGYSYEFKPGVIKMRETKKPLYKTFLHKHWATPSLNQLVFTEKEAVRILEEQLFEEKLRRQSAGKAKATSKGNGQLILSELNYPDKAKNPVSNIYITSASDKSWLRVYAGNTTHFHELPPGKYSMYYRLKDGMAFSINEIEAKQDGKTYLNVRIQALVPFTSFKFEEMNLVDSYRPTEKEIEDKRNVQAKSTHPNVWQQLERTIYGTVVSAEDDLPLPGVNVSVKGSHISTVTDIEGRYVLATPKQGTLLFNFIGFATTEREIGNDAIINARLMPDIKQLAEVIVTGYGIQRRALTAAVSSVDLNNTLQGRMAGVNITNKQPLFSIRGMSSGVPGSSPLIIINGVPYEGRLEDLPQSAILSVNSLNSPEATALYGSRAANGVLLITTSTGLVNPTGKDGVAIPSIEPQEASVRSNFSDYAFWKPDLITDADGKASFKVKLPDDITSWNTHVLAMNGNKQSGQTSGQIKSYKTLSGHLALPRFMVEDDESYLIGKAMNYRPDTFDVKTHFYIGDSLAYTKQSSLGRFHLDTLRLLGSPGDSLIVRYMVDKMDGYQDGEERSLPIFPKGISESKGVFMRLDKDTTIQLYFDPALGKVTVQTQQDLLEVMIKEINHIKAYPYYCNEQVASILIAHLEEKKILEAQGKPYQHHLETQRLVRKLEQSRTPRQLWGWWPQTESLSWVSHYVLEALLQAEQAGYEINIPRYELANYSRILLEKGQGKEKLYPLQLLIRLEPKTNLKPHLEAIERDTLGMYEYLQTLKIRQDHNLPYSLDSVLKLQKETQLGNLYWHDDYMHPFRNNIQNTLLAYQLLKNAGGYEHILPHIQGYLLEGRSEGHWRNTYESASILMTILPDLLKGSPQAYNSRLWVGNTTMTEISTFEESYTFPAGSIQLRFEGKRPLFFTAYQSYHVSKPEKVDKDYSVKTYFAEGVQTLKAGEPVQLIAEVQVKKSSDYVLIEIPIPAGCSYESKAPARGKETYREYYKEKTSIFCQQLPPGRYTFTVSLQPRFTGHYTLNPAKVSLMYFPVFFGRNELKTVHIKTPAAPIKNTEKTQGTANR